MLHFYQCDVAASAQVREVDYVQIHRDALRNLVGEKVFSDLMSACVHPVGKREPSPEPVPVAQEDVEAEARRLFEANSAALRKVVAEMRKTAAMFPDSPFASTVRRWAKDLATAAKEVDHGNCPCGGQLDAPEGNCDNCGSDEQHRKERAL
jgi:hypothetical protein